MPLTHFVVDTALHLAHSGPPLFLLHLRVIMKDLIPQPGQIVDTHFVFLAFIDTAGRAHSPIFALYCTLTEN